MAVLSHEELMNRIKDRLGDDTSDDALSFLEDVADTLAENGDVEAVEGWTRRYNELEEKYSQLAEENKTIRQKYRDRFFSDTSEMDSVEVKEPVEPDEPPKKYDDLFE